MCYNGRWVVRTAANSDIVAYYKIQSFFFIPLLGFQQVLLPVISYNFGAGQVRRIQQTVRFALLLSTGLMLAATAVFLLFPRLLLTIFCDREELLQIGEYAFRVISLNFVPAGITIVVISHLQGIAKMKLSIFVIVLQQVVLLVPLAWFLHFVGLKAVWWTFPLTDLIVVIITEIHIHHNLISGSLGFGENVKYAAE